MTKPITAAGGNPGNGADIGDGKNITFNTSAGDSTVILAGGGLTTISTGTTGGNISFTNNLLRSTANEPLTLTSGTGDITFGENVGAGTAAQALGKVIISNAKDVTISGTFTATEIAQTVLGTGTFTNAGLITTTAGGARIQSKIVDLDAGITAAGQAVDIDSSTGLLILNGGAIDTSGGTNQAAGTINLNTTGGNINLSGSLLAKGATKTGADGVGFAGGAVTLGTTGAGTITLNTLPTSLLVVVMVRAVRIMAVWVVPSALTPSTKLLPS